MSGSRAHGRRLIRACGAALVWLSLAAWPLFAQDEDAMSVADFVRQQPKWQVLKETTLKVEVVTPSAERAAAIQEELGRLLFADAA